MSDATANVPTRMKEGDILALPMDGAAQTIYQGTLVNRDGTGYAVKAANTSGHVFGGVASEKKVISATETDGTTKVKCWQKHLHRFAISSVAVTDVGKWVYVSDSQTVTTTAGYVPCGVIRAIEGSTWVWIDIEPALAMANQEPHDHSSAAQGGGLTSPHVTTGLEAWWPCLADPAHRAPYDAVLMGDLRGTLPLLASGQFDLVLALGVLEHLEAEEAMGALVQARRVAAGTLVAQVPIAPFPQGEVDGNPYTPHRSQWTRRQWERTGGRLVAASAASGLFVWEEGG